ncbi:uncharacterized protein G2W53_020059 [Senna tora]|uniref:Uncharacterized protein n=1 Tax=Senna tora TaxID=362788 RepID=A0A834TZL2_9FABA|nr:uncharacterized protein G2W53_020059 [Senna tora]
MEAAAESTVLAAARLVWKAMGWDWERNQVMEVCINNVDGLESKASFESQEPSQEFPHQFPFVIKGRLT